MTTQRLSLERPSAFRRRRFVVPHRRRSRTSKLLRPFLVAVALVGVPVATGLWVYTSPRFLLKEVHIGPTGRVTTAEIASALSPLRGRHLFDLSLADVEARLVTHTWIENAAIRKELPDRIVVEIEERQPVALLRRQEGLYYVDGSGYVIDAYDPLGPVDLVLLSVAPGASLQVDEALALATELQRWAPRIGLGLSEIEILGEGDFRVYTAALEFPLLVSAAELGAQMTKLERLLPDISRRFTGVESVDLRFSRQIVIQPADEPRSQEG